MVSVLQHSKNSVFYNSLFSIVYLNKPAEHCTCCFVYMHWASLLIIKQA